MGRREEGQRGALAVEDGVAREGPRLNPDGRLHGTPTRYGRDVQRVVEVALLQRIARDENTVA